MIIPAELILNQRTNSVVEIAVSEFHLPARRVWITRDASKPGHTRITLEMLRMKGDAEDFPFASAAFFLSQSRQDFIARLRCVLSEIAKSRKTKP